MNLLANLNASVVNCNDLQGIMAWHHATTTDLNSVQISDSQLEAHYYAFNGGLVPALGPKPYRQKIINGIFDQLAVQMEDYSMDNWLVAKQIIGKGWTDVIVMIDMVAFLKCGEPFQEAWLNAVMIPNDMELSARRDLFPFPDGYTDIGDRLSAELLKINPTHGDWHALAKWLNYSILQAHRFNADRWKGQIGFLLRNLRIDAYVTESPLNYNNDDNPLLGSNRHATMTRSNTRLDGTVTKGSGATGTACSSLDGRDGMTGCQQKQGRLGEMTPMNDGFEWNNMAQFTRIHYWVWTRERTGIWSPGRDETTIPYLQTRRDMRNQSGIPR